jgi:TPR repeat protein
MPQASAQLQAKYEDGLSFMRANDPVAAGQAFTEAAQEGHPGAIREIAVAAFDDLPKAIVWGVVPLFERAAARGDGRAMSYLGLFCRLKEDDQGALEHYRASDQRGDPEGSRELGILLARLGRVDEGLVAVERARSRGSASGALAQGILLEKNFGDRDGAREAFLAAAEMGHPKGSFHLIDLFISEGNQGAAERERSRALQNLTEHRALMELLEGESAVQRTMAQVESGSALAASGSSCALPAGTTLVAALCLSYALLS